jgi:hypothetical protein
VVVVCPAVSNEPVDGAALLARARGGSLLLDVVSDLSLSHQDALSTALRHEAGRPPRPGQGVRVLSTARLELLGSGGSRVDTVDEGAMEAALAGLASSPAPARP